MTTIGAFVKDKKIGLLYGDVLQIKGDKHHSHQKLIALPEFNIAFGYAGEFYVITNINRFELDFALSQTLNKKYDSVKFISSLLRSRLNDNFPDDIPSDSDFFKTTINYFSTMANTYFPIKDYDYKQLAESYLLMSREEFFPRLSEEIKAATPDFFYLCAAASYDYFLGQTRNPDFIFILNQNDVNMYHALSSTDNTYIMYKDPFYTNLLIGSGRQFAYEVLREKLIVPGSKLDMSVEEMAYFSMRIVKEAKEDEFSSGYDCVLVTPHNIIPFWEDIEAGMSPKNLVQKVLSLV